MPLKPGPYEERRDRIVKVDSTATQPKGARGTLVKVLVVAVVIVGVVVGFAETNGFYTGAVTKYFYTTSYAAAATTVVLSAVAANGNLVPTATYRVGQSYNLSITEQSPVTPLAVHEVFNGTVYKDLAWNVNATGHTYIITDTAHASDIGTSPDYVVVAFSDNNIAFSNTITITITP
jgi:hypothetical protein